MKTIVQFSFIFFLFNLITACTPEAIDIDVPQAPSRPVVASQYYFDTLTQQSVLVIALTNSISVSKDGKPTIDTVNLTVDEKYVIKNARLKLTTPRETYTFTEVESGIYYAFNVMLNTGDYCVIEALDENKKSIFKSSSWVGNETDFKDLFISKNGAHHYVNYTITDNVSSKDFYLVNYLTKQKQDNPDYTNPNYIAKRLTEQTLNFDLYTDADFKNGVLEKSVKLSNLEIDSIGIAISSISEGYYAFLKAQKRYGLLVNQLKGEVINFPSNIQGGLGYFHLSQPKAHILFINN
jgi:hypothetical protein